MEQARKPQTPLNKQSNATLDQEAENPSTFSATGSPSWGDNSGLPWLQAETTPAQGIVTGQSKLLPLHSISTTENVPIILSGTQNADMRQNYSQLFNKPPA